MTYKAQIPELTYYAVAGGGTARASCPTIGINSSTCDTGLPMVTPGSGTLPGVLSVVFGVIGVVAVLVVVLAGLRLMLAQGDPQAAATARRTLLYALAGLGVAISAEVIVVFVLGRL